MAGAGYKVSTAARGMPGLVDRELGIRRAAEPAGPRTCLSPSVEDAHG